MNCFNLSKKCLPWVTSWRGAGSPVDFIIHGAGGFVKDEKREKKKADDPKTVCPKAINTYDRAVYPVSQVLSSSVSGTISDLICVHDYCTIPTGIVYIKSCYLSSFKNDNQYRFAS